MGICSNHSRDTSNTSLFAPVFYKQIRFVCYKVDCISLLLVKVASECVCAYDQFNLDFYGLTVVLTFVISCLVVVSLLICIRWRGDAWMYEGDCLSKGIMPALMSIMNVIYHNLSAKLWTYLKNYSVRNNWKPWSCHKSGFFQLSWMQLSTHKVQPSVAFSHENNKAYLQYVALLSLLKI